MIRFAFGGNWWLGLFAEVLTAIYILGKPVCSAAHCAVLIGLDCSAGIARHRLVEHCDGMSPMSNLTVRLTPAVRNQLQLHRCCSQSVRHSTACRLIVHAAAAGVAIAQIIASASSQYAINKNYNKLEWGLILGGKGSAPACRAAACSELSQGEIPEAQQSHGSLL